MRHADALFSLSVAILSATAVSILSAQSPASTSPPTSAQPSTEVTGETMTISGCVYRATDDASVFALERTRDANGASGLVAKLA